MEIIILLIEITLKFVSKDLINISSDNGLLSNKHQAIIWTNDSHDCLVYRHMYVSLALDKLKR